MTVGTSPGAAARQHGGQPLRAAASRTIVAVGVDVGSAVDPLAVTVATYTKLDQPGRRPVHRGVLRSVQATPGIDYPDIPQTIMGVLAFVREAFPGLPVCVAIDATGPGIAAGQSLEALLRDSTWADKPTLRRVSIQGGDKIRAIPGTTQVNASRTALIESWIISANASLVDFAALAPAEAQALYAEMRGLARDAAGRADHQRGKHDDRVWSAVLAHWIACNVGLGPVSTIALLKGGRRARRNALHAEPTPANPGWAQLENGA